MYKKWFSFQVIDQPPNVSLSYAPQIISTSNKEQLIEPVSVFVPSEALQRAAELENGSKSNIPENVVRVVSILQRTSIADLNEWVR